MKKVVTVVLNSFENDSRVLKEAISLLNNGYDISVAALHRADLQEHQQVQQVPVHRIRLKSMNWPKLKPVQILKYLEFLYRVVRTYGNTDIVHCNDLHTLPVGFFIKRFLNKSVKIVYDAHEFEINDRPNQSRFNIRIKYFLEKFLIRYADKIITVSNSIAVEYAKLYGIEKPALVLNAPPYKALPRRNLFREAFGLSKQQTIFLYQGGLNHGRGIEIMLDAFAQTDPDKVLVCMGYGPLQALVEEKSVHCSNIHYHQAVAPDILLEYTASADFGILFYENNCLNHYYCSPNKIFEYLMAGIPVIVSNLYEMRRIVQNNRLGVVAEDDTVQGLKSAVDKALQLDPAELQANISKVKLLYNWEAQEETLLDTYRDLYPCAASAG